MPSKFCVDLRPSTQLKICVGLLFFSFIVLIIIAPWSPNHRLIALFLVIVLVSQCINAFRRVNAVKGCFVVTDANLEWQQQSWKMTQLITYRAVLLIHFLSLETQKRGSLVLFSDNVTSREWRNLCYHLHQLDQQARLSAKNSRRSSIK